MSKKWYVVTVGKEVGVFDDWLYVAALVRVTGATWKGFEDEELAHRRFAEENARGNVYVVHTRSTSGQGISRSGSAATMTSGHHVNVPVRSQTLPNNNEAGQTGSNLGAQTVTPPQSPRPSPAASRRRSHGRSRRSDHSSHASHPRPPNHVSPPIGPYGLIPPPPPLRAYPNHSRSGGVGVTPREYDSRNAANSSRRYDFSTSTLLQSSSAPIIRNSASEHYAPRRSTYEATSISAPVPRQRSGSSTSSVSTGSAVTCPESPFSSATSSSSLVEPLELDDTEPPVYPMSPRTHVGQTQATPIVPSRGASRSPSPDLSQDFSRVTIRLGDHRLHRYISPPISAPNTSTQPLLSPLSIENEFASEYRASKPLRDQPPSTPARSPSGARKLPLDKANLPVYSVHGSDSEPEEEVKSSPISRTSSAADKRRACAARMWASLGSPQVQHDLHHTAFDPRSPIHKGTRVPRDANNSMFSRPSPRAFAPNGASNSVYVR